SPRHRGTRWNLTGSAAWLFGAACFSPLVIGALGGTLSALAIKLNRGEVFQSPRHRGTRWNEDYIRTSGCDVFVFQSPRHRGTRWNTPGDDRDRPAHGCFSPLVIGALGG